MDAVVLANYFHQHAPFAVKALEAGYHVMSETSACKTLGQAVKLVRAVEASGCIYMLAENYPYFAYNQEMRRLYRDDAIGELRYGEGEYVHPMRNEYRYRISPGLEHWRNWLPSTYYCTHALAPLMYISDLRPVSVNAQSIPFSDRDEERPWIRRGDPAATILCRMDNDALVALNGINLRGHGNWYRLHGTRGLMENLRTHGDQNKLRVVHDPWDLREGEVTEMIYTPEFPVAAELAARSGHGGGDFFTSYHFAQAIRSGEQPYLNVYRALDMTLVGIQAWKSALANGAPYEIPDMRQEAPRQEYEGEDWSPFAEDVGPDQPPQSIRSRVEPTEEQLEEARRVWRSVGHEG
jgi:predicted dehydrogenase